MKTTTKRWLIAATVLLFVSAILFVGLLATVDFDFSRLSTRQFETNTYEVSEDFERMIVNETTAAVTFAPTDEGVCKIVCVEEKALKHSVKIQDGTLLISVLDSRRWYDHIGISFRAPTVTVYLPKDVYTSLSVATVTGDIVLPDGFGFETVTMTGTTADISCSADVSKSIALNTTTGDITLGSVETETVKLSATTGKVVIHDVSCHTLTAKSSTGRIQLENVIAEESIQIENTTGGVRFNDCDAAKITVQTSTGDVKGTLLSEKIFVVDTSTGKVRVPRTASGGICEITTSTGDIEIEIE